MVNSKICPLCKVQKPLSEFDKQVRYCKPCHNIKAGEWRSNNREKDRLSKLKWSRANKRKQKYNRNYYLNNKQYYKDKNDQSKDKYKPIIIKKIIEYLLEHPCVDCGEKHPIKLTFDHVRGKKLFNISESVCVYKWDTIKKEIDKCDVRCHNCHNLKTATERNFLSLKIFNSINVVIQN